MQTLQRQKQVDHEQLVNDSPRTFTEADFPVGTVAHQGDVILVRIAALPVDSLPRTQRQVAEGNTPGARHVLEGGEIWDSDARHLIADATGVVIAEQYIGPVFRGGCLKHPEHGDHTYQEDMILAVVFQRNLDAEQGERRVLD